MVFFFCDLSWLLCYVSSHMIMMKRQTSQKLAVNLIVGIQVYIILDISFIDFLLIVISCRD